MHVYTHGHTQTLCSHLCHTPTLTHTCAHSRGQDFALCPIQTVTRDIGLPPIGGGIEGKMGDACRAVQG